MARKSRKNLPQNTPIAANEIKYTAWGYARISNDGERSEDSIESQTAIIQDYVSDRSDIELQTVITDLGFSGTNFLRPGFAELMDGIQSNKVQCVVVKDLSRVGRTYIEVGEFLFDTLPAHKVRFISVNDQYDSFADDAARKKLLILFKNLVNHMYSKDLGVKIRSSHALKQQKGELLGALPPYGFMFTTEGGGKRLKIEPESAEVVKLIFDMREQGNSLIKITQHLNQQSILPPRKHSQKLGYSYNEKDGGTHLWQSSTVSKILRNIAHIGHQAQGKCERNGRQAKRKPQSEWIIHENAHPAIIDKAQFDTVQKLMDEAAEIRKKKRTDADKLDENIYIGKLFCSRCGGAVSRQFSHTRELGHRYRVLCRACGHDLRQSHGVKKLPVFWLDKLEEIIVVVLQKQIDACLEISDVIAKVTESKAISSKRHDLKNELSRFLRSSKKADDMLATAYTHHLAGILDSHEFELARTQFEQDKKVAETKIAQLAKEADGYDIEKVQQNAFIANFQRFNGFAELDKELVSTLIKRIEITPQSNEVHIIFNFMDEFEELSKIIAESEVLNETGKVSSKEHKVSQKESGVSADVR